ncbi:DUF885 domain-containing protein [Parvularcula sp. LCG005]|uniref:DUF885 domain-containing protein n=1 Tax=Parvularcula sp. LCG005 TaxID=3078805 RepID=UPI00294309E9|nr:DUF885 domain-containing protein [Parvularcula sp. LCG005]WOI52768.1 DUF885 domain-containing protein [Parvularcula sp. LCG005]
MTRTCSSLLVLIPLLMACGESGTSQPSSTTATETAAASAEATQSESERLNAWFDVVYEEQILRSPLTLTSLGRKERYDEWDDFTAAAGRDEAEWLQAKADEMAAQFDYDALDDEAKMSYDLWTYQADRAMAGLAFIDHGFIFDQMTGIHSLFPTYLINFHKVDTLSDMEAYIARLEAIDPAVVQLIARGESAIDTGYHSPKFANEIVREESAKIISGAPFDEGDDSSLYADAKAKIAALLDAGTIDQAKADELTEKVEAALVGPVATAYGRIITFLEDDLANAPEEASGIGGMPDGQAYYAYRLQQSTTTDMSPEEVHQLGLSEIERLTAEMNGLKEKAEFDGTFEDFVTYIKEAEWNYYPDTDEGRQAYIDDATAAIDNIKAELPNYFGILPKADLVVKRVEAFREQDGAAQHYFNGTPDGSRPGVYYAHLSDMTSMPKNQLEVIAYHEGLPGHHMQISIAQELDSVPQFRTQYGSTAYIEGWALYTEYLAKEMPNTYVDVYSDAGRLSSEMWRAIRLVVDTGLHAKGWTEEEAIAFAQQYSARSRTTIQSEVRRYIVIPGQATSYKIGMLKILELREKARTELGEQFDIRDFHDVVLGGGALPLSLLERRVDEWIAASKA